MTARVALDRSGEPRRALIYVAEVPPSLGEWSHWKDSYRYHESQRWKAILRAAAMRVPMFRTPVTVAVKYEFRAARPRDYEQMPPRFLLGALRRRVLPDDSCAYVARVVTEIALRAEADGTTITLERIRR